MSPIVSFTGLFRLEHLSGSVAWIRGIVRNGADRIMPGAEGGGR